MKRRIEAYLKHHRIEGVNDIPFVLIPETVNFRDGQSVEALISLLKEYSARFGLPIRWVIVDTLNRAIAGGDENASADMGDLIGNADHLRIATGAHVTFTHHIGKDVSKGARGHSSLRGAIDTEVEIKRIEDAIVATVTKQRDLDSGHRFAFRLVNVELGYGKWGKPMASCVVEEAVIKPVLTETEQGASGARIAVCPSRALPHVGSAYPPLIAPLRPAWRYRLRHSYRLKKIFLSFATCRTCLRRRFLLTEMASWQS